MLSIPGLLQLLAGTVLHTFEYLNLAAVASSEAQAWENTGSYHLN